MAEATNLDRLRELTDKLDKSEDERDLALHALREAYDEIQRTRILFAIKRRRGWIDVGGTRMFLVDLSCWWWMRKMLEDRIGKEEAVKFYFDSGYNERFTLSALKHGFLTRTEKGFRSAVDCYSEAGFGGFVVEEVNYEQGFALISCIDAFEASGVRDNGKHADVPICDYSRGVLLAFMAKLTDLSGLTCEETTCRAKGDAVCTFRIGHV